MEGPAGQRRGPGGRGLHVGCVGCSRRQPGPGDFVGGVGENVCTPNAMAGNPQHAGASRRRSSWDWALAWDLNALPPARSALFWGLGRAWGQNGFPRPCARGRRPELRGVPPGPGWLRLSVSLRPIAGLLAAARARGVVEAAERNSPRDGRPRGLRTAVRTACDEAGAVPDRLATFACFRTRRREERQRRCRTQKLPEASRPSALHLPGLREDGAPPLSACVGTGRKCAGIRESSRSLGSDSEPLLLPLPPSLSLRAKGEAEKPVKVEPGA